MNWDDLKYFLAVCRAGSIRGAAQELDVNHATVSRRIKAFETSLGKRLFERHSGGYEKTRLAEELYAEACHLEGKINKVARHLVAKEQQLSGEIRVTMPDSMAQTLFMPTLAEFSRQHPDIELEIIASSKLFNLANRDADLAIRICEQPPEHLIGKRLADIHRACYMRKQDKHRLSEADWLAKQNWIGWSDKFRRPVGPISRAYPGISGKHKIANALVQTQACIAGMGVAVLPCFIADREDSLMRVPPYLSEGKYSLWLVYHPDLRENKRIQALIGFICEQMHQLKPLLEGKAPGVVLAHSA